MGMRITTGMVMNSYRYNLQQSTLTLSNTRNTALSGRNFNSYAEDPAAATQAWRIRRAMSSNFDYQSNNSDTYSRFNIASTTMGVVSNKLTDLAGRFSTIRGDDGSIGAGRQPLGLVISETADTVIQAMNSAKYGDHFVFSGNDEMNPPFSWDGDKLLYRGINVGAGAVAKPVEPWANEPIDAVTGLPENMPASSTDPWESAWIAYYNDQALVAKGDPTAQNLPKPQEVPAWAEDLNANGQPNDPPAEANATAWEKEWLKYFEAKKTDPKAEKPTIDPSEKDTATWGTKDQFGIPEKAKEIAENKDGTYSKDQVAWAKYLIDQGDVAKLDYLSNEERNVDLGMGLREDKDGVLVNGTAFNRSLPGINMLGGYGVDEDGDPKNVVLIMKRIGELFSNSDPDSGAWANEGDEEEARRLLDKLNDSHSGVVENYSELEARAQYLQQNQTRLETQGDYLQEERVNIEQVDLADAFTEFLYAYNCYSAALKIGTQLLSQSLLDYMG